MAKLVVGLADRLRITSCIYNSKRLIHKVSLLTPKKQYTHILLIVVFNQSNYYNIKGYSYILKATFCDKNFIPRNDVFKKMAVRYLSPIHR